MPASQKLKWPYMASAAAAANQKIPPQGPLRITRQPSDAVMLSVQGINGNKMEKACDLVHITLNKNAVVGDVSALAPGGVRIGAPAMTSRGLQESRL